MKELIMDLACDYAQEAKDFGHLSNSVPRKALADALERLTARNAELEASAVNTDSMLFDQAGRFEEDIESLTAENAALKEGLDGWHSRYLDVQTELERLTAERDDVTSMYNRLVDDVHAARAERDALRTDAERYRWLRDESCGHPFWKQFDAGMTSNGMDSAIDAAIGEKT